MNLGLKNLIMVDRFGIIDEGMEELNPAQAEMAELTNREHKRGTLADALQGADVFFGVSAPNVLTPEMIKTMAADPIVFAMANPTPEIMPDAAKAARRESGGHWTQRFSQSDQQCHGVSGDFPRRSGLPCLLHQRGNESGNLLCFGLLSP